jgi:hypothetical protein
MDQEEKTHKYDYISTYFDDFLITAKKVEKYIAFFSSSMYN